MIQEKEAVDILKKVEHIGVDVWIDGGWGVDALLGHTTRPHNDIDIFVQKKDSTTFIEMLYANGYSEIKMQYTTDDHTVWHDSDDRIIDLHLFEFAEAGTLCYDNEIYPSDILNGKGTIGGIAVNCLSVESQIRYHQGYKHREQDIHDVLLLCKVFKLPVPEEYVEHYN